MLRFLHLNISLSYGYVFTKATIELNKNNQVITHVHTQLLFYK